MSNKNEIQEINKNEEQALKKINFLGRVKLKIREYKNEIKEDISTLKSMNKKELFTKIFSSRYFILFTFIIILLKTLLFSADTVFYKEGIWLWYIRQTSFFIIIMVAPMFLFRNSRCRFAYGMILDFLVSLLLFADELYYSYASNIISVMQARKFAIWK